MTKITSYSKPLIAFAGLFTAAFAGCAGSDGSMPADPTRSVEAPRDFGAIVSEAQEASARLDAFDAQQCGSGSCTPTECGYQCAAGAICQRACSPTNDRYESYVLFQVSGAETATLDSRENAYRPVARLNDVLFYGTDLWTFSETRHGLGIEYRDVAQGAFTTTAPYRYGAQVEVYTRDFRGPGSYTADVQYQAQSSRAADGTASAAPVFFKKAGCTLNVTSEEGKLRGTFNCPSIPSTAGGAVTIAGEFLSTGTSIDGPLLTAKSH